MSQILSNNHDLETEIKNIFLEIFPKIALSDFDWNKQQKDYPDWDSFAQLHLIALAESKFDIEIDVENSINFTSAKDLLECVKSLL